MALFVYQAINQKQTPFREVCKETKALGVYDGKIILCIKEQKILRFPDFILKQSFT